MNTERLLTYKDIGTMLNRNYKTIWKWVKIGIFPEPVRFQGRTIGWKRADIEKWLSENS
ncbi:helix-turn-helix transcriptional regulator [Vibrio aestuarianus]|uniref:AlpA family phage regulatory protein n=1 Tax=Vibrio aestuarianus TaxID=28171 RepID=A0ABM9FMB9_9VIBR|nr:AlpA family phage regulatory protein [Vibrio aestuarianus]MDE1212680.1 AlpA family phage regulatory protein [Vibrio aestuarianus]MDE1255454.1 AlpA family phage regulatory protein [Vibrio aestuarianus]MDE1259788.1 AlpA family phage regulatory protein [Vibrio aestuarianus]MDE1268453.1 AlpA family phage regulatory protein [Vibrio aestuarianus]MDE1274050.1 AlpA family phage regulatory protein [Vibrio aestuarianus]